MITLIIVIKLTYRPKSIIEKKPDKQASLDYDICQVNAEINYLVVNVTNT